MRRKRGGDPNKQRQPEQSGQGQQHFPAEWVPMPPEWSGTDESDPDAWQHEVIRGTVPPPRYQQPPQQYPPGYYQQPPPQVHYIAPPAPIQQNVVVHTKGRGCFGTLFQGVGFVVVAIIVILILIAIL